MVEADAVGEMVADAVAEGRFLVLTFPVVQNEIVDRAADLDAYIEKSTT